MVSAEWGHSVCMKLLLSKNAGVNKAGNGICFFFS